MLGLWLGFSTGGRGLGQLRGWRWLQGRRWLWGWHWLQGWHWLWGWHQRVSGWWYLARLEPQLSSRQLRWLCLGPCYRQTCPLGLEGGGMRGR